MPTLDKPARHILRLRRDYDGITIPTARPLGCTLPVGNTRPEVAVVNTFERLCAIDADGTRWIETEFKYIRGIPLNSDPTAMPGFPREPEPVVIPAPPPGVIVRDRQFVRSWGAQARLQAFQRGDWRRAAPGCALAVAAARALTSPLTHEISEQ